MASTISEILWFRWVLNELDTAQSVATPLFYDNEVSRHIANNPVFHERTKHVEMDCHFFRERVESNEIKPIHIESGNKIVDLLMKTLSGYQFKFLLDKFGILNLHTLT